MDKGSGNNNSGNSAAGSAKPFDLKHGGIDAALLDAAREHWWFLV